MTKIEDVSTPNSEIEQYFKDWFTNNVIKILMNWMIHQVGRLWLDARLSSTHFYSMLCFILLNSENKEFVLDYDKYVETAKKLKEDYPKGFLVHGYVKDDNKFHVWLEERKEDNSELFYDNLFGQHVEVNNE